VGFAIAGEKSATLRSSGCLNLRGHSEVLTESRHGCGGATLFKLLCDVIIQLRSLGKRNQRFLCDSVICNNDVCRGKSRSSLLL
jgi:hypothetical protein